MHYTYGSVQVKSVTSNECLRNFFFIIIKNDAWVMKMFQKYQ